MGESTHSMPNETNKITTTTTLPTTVTTMPPYFKITHCTTAKDLFPSDWIFVVLLLLLLSLFYCHFFKRQITFLRASIHNNNNKILFISLYHGYLDTNVFPSHIISRFCVVVFLFFCWNCCTYIKLCVSFCWWRSLLLYARLLCQNLWIKYRYYIILYIHI